MAKKVILPVDSEFDNFVENFTPEFKPIVVTEIEEQGLNKVTPKKDFSIHIGRREYEFIKDKPQYVTPSDEHMIRQDPSKLY